MDRQRVEAKRLGSLLQLVKGRSTQFAAQRPVSLRYMANLAFDVSKFTLIVLVTIVTLFLSDVIVSGILPTLLAHGTGISTISLIVLYSVPNGLFIALPTALLIGVYIVFLRRREEQVFKISAGFGYSPRTLITIALAIGFVGAVVSLILSGFVEPPARYLFSTTMNGAAHKAIRDGELSSGRFYQVGDTTFYAASGRLNEVAGDVFLHQRRSESVGRVVVASQLVGQQFNKQGRFDLLFKNANLYEFADQDDLRESKKSTSSELGCLGCDPDDFLAPLKHLYFDKFYMALPKANLAPPRDWTLPEETNLLNLFFVSKWGPKHVEVLGERILRAALCLVTPLLALVAVALTFKSTLLLSLPTAAGGVLVLSFFAS